MIPTGLKYLAGPARADYMLRLVDMNWHRRMQRAVAEASARQIFPELKLKPEGTEAIGGDQKYVTNLDSGRHGPKSDPWPWIFLIVLVLVLAVAALGAGLLIWYPPAPKTQQTPATPALVPGTEKIGISVQ